LHRIYVINEQKSSSIILDLVPHLMLLPVSEVYIPNYLQLAKTEYQGSQLKPGDHVLFLGSSTSGTQKAIFDHLADVLPAGTKLSYRIYEKGLRLLLDTFSRYELPEPFVEYLRIAPKPPVNNTVVFLTTNGVK